MLKKAFTLVLFLVFLPDLSAFQKPSKKDYLITIQTNYGEMKAILYEDTPLHRENFLKLIEEGFYDSLLFHRVIQGFMIQGGDPDSRRAEPGSRLGNGGPGYRIPAEIDSAYFHKKGALAAARRGNAGNPQKESSGSQFYIVQGEVQERDKLAYNQQNIGLALRKCFNEMPETDLAKSLEALRKAGNQQGFIDKVMSSLPELEELTQIELSSDYSEEALALYTTIGGTPSLDDEYTVFGEVIIGLDIIDKIAEVETNRSDRPIEDVVMVISAERMRKKKITKRYGYVYE
jgi:peptidyl-prolyl cis-trans isomerase B (cyclophilin B)